MSTVRAISGATEVQFRALTNTAKELGAVTRFSATQAGEGMEFLARAGFEVEEVLAAIGPVLQLAQAGALDLGSAANIASNVLKGFRLEAEETGRVVDVLAAAAAASNTDVRKLGQALSFVAPIAASMGIAVEEAAAAIGVLGDAGIPATRAGRGLNLILATLEKGSDGLAAAAKRAGLTLEDFKPTAVGVAGALANLEKANIGAGEAFDLFGKLGAPAFNVLQNGIPRIVELTEELENAKGSAEEIARVMDDNLNGALLRVRSAFQSVVLEFGDGERAGGLLRTGFEKLAEGLRFLAKNIDIVVNVAEALAVVIGVKLVRAFARLAIAIALNPLGALITAITLATALFVGFADKIGLSADSFATLQDVGVAVFETLSEALGGFSVSFESLGEFAGKAFDVVKSGLVSLVRSAAQRIDSIVGFFRGGFAAIGVIFDELAENSDAVGELMKKAFRDAMEFIIDITFSGFQTIGDFIFRFFDRLQQIIANTAGALGALSKGNLAAAQAFAQNNEDLVKNLARSFGTIPGIFRSNLEKLRKQELLPEVEISKQAQDIGRRAGDAFREGFQQGAGAENLLDKTLGRARELGAARAAEDAQPVVVTGDIEKATDDFDKLKAAVEGVPPAIEQVVEQISLLSEVMDGIVVVAFENAGDALLDFAETGKFVFKDFVNQLLDDIARLLVRLLVLQAIQAATGTGAATQAGGAAAGAASRQAGGPVDSMRPFFVGEQGPEIFQPQGSGNIIPAAETAALMSDAGARSSQTVVVEVSAPPVNVNVINQTDPNEFKEVIDSGELDVNIVNALSRRKSAARQSLGV